jgi:NAD(P)-dependent dehydrogenase (short-subunit alcohol dehydrogenase family)
MNRLDLDGKRVIVTGAAGGLGFAVAKRLAASGARVALWDRDATALAQAAGEIGGSPATFTIDIADPEAVSAGVAQTIASLGGVDALVNNAGISGPNTVTWEYPVEDWRRVLDINLTGTFLCSRAVIPHMLANNYGRIVNVASVAGKEGNPSAPAYSASKAGVIALTKSLGKELARSGVLVNCVTPGAVRTAIFDEMSEEHVQFMLSKIPMGRFGQADEIAALVAWLCTEECSFSTGAVFDLSGGRATY